MKDNDDDNDDGRWKSVLINLPADKDFVWEESRAIVESIEEEQEDNRDGDGVIPGMETGNQSRNLLCKPFSEYPSRRASKSWISAVPPSRHPKGR
jgi:hypothetical protein